MSKNARLPLITVQQADPETLAQLTGSARKNRRAMTKKQQYDAARSRLRADVSPAVKQAVDTLAAQLHTSANDVIEFLLHLALIEYQNRPAEIEDLMDFQTSDSPRKQITLTTAKLPTISETEPSARSAAPSNGANDGANEWGEWLKPN